MGNNAVIMHSKGYYVALDTHEAPYYVVELEGGAPKRFRKWIKEFISKKRKIPDDL